MRRFLQFFLPFAILAAAAGGFALLQWLQPEARPQDRAELPPIVRVHEAATRTVDFTVRSQGNVAPRTEIDLVPQVSGAVIEVSPSLVAGGSFAKGEVLLRIDPRDLELAVAQQQAAIARARLRIAQEEAEAATALQEWRRMGLNEKPTPLVLREPQLAEARADLAAAEAARDKAKLDLERTVLRAPFAGRVRSESVDAGQHVTAGQPIAHLYAVDFAEVVLPVPDRDLAFLDLPLGFQAGEDGEGPKVRLTAEFAGREWHWNGHVHRTGGAIDTRTRLVDVIVRVERPYDANGDRERPPLAVGMFVEAAIGGRRVEDVVVLPSNALRPGNEVLVVDRTRHLHRREVAILRRNPDEVVLSEGVEAGEWVCLSALDTVTDGMRVRVHGRTPPTADDARPDNREEKE